MTKTFKGSVLTAGAAAILAGSAFADTLHVPAGYPTIQGAVDAALPGDTILVAPGAYVESVTLKPGVILRGSGADVTTIEGDGSLIDRWGYPATLFGADDGAITGFTIAGAVFNWGSSPTITDNIILGNGQWGVYNYYGSATIADNVVAGTGSGIISNRSDALIVHNIVTDCDTGIASSYGSVTIINNTVTGMTYDGIYNGAASPIIANNIIVDNGRHAVRNINGSFPTIIHNDLMADQRDINDDGSSSSTLSDNISANPMFVDPEAGDYRLGMGSPCIDAGTNDAPGLPELDADGNPRIFDGDGDDLAVVDMGAYEYMGGGSPPPAPELPPGAEAPSPGSDKGGKAGWEGGVPPGFDKGNKKGWGK
ncbi:MAG: right-handed parallel beta-helix repeat-containing protein [Elusimicrobiota bacterium]